MFLAARGLVTELFKHAIDKQSPSAIKTLALALHGLSIYCQLFLLLRALFTLDHWELFDRNTGWSGPIEIDPEEAWVSFLTNKRNKRREGQQEERARRRLVRPVKVVTRRDAFSLTNIIAIGTLSPDGRKKERGGSGS